jgi:hypothetical protein
MIFGCLESRWRGWDRGSQRHISVWVVMAVRVHQVRHVGASVVAVHVCWRCKLDFEHPYRRLSSLVWD